MRTLSLLVTVAILSILAVGSQAQTTELWGSGSIFDTANAVVINGSQYFNTDSGWFHDDGRHFAGNQNYSTGYCSPNDCVYGGYYHGYFSFDLTKFVGNASSASFTVNNYDLGTDPGTLTLYGTSLMTSDVNSEQDWFDIGKYEALNMGPVIGTISLSPNQSRTYSTITLNADGIAWLDSHAGEGAVIGTDWEPVPEPSTLVLLGSGLMAGVGMFRQKLF